MKKPPKPCKGARRSADGRYWYIDLRHFLDLTALIESEGRIVMRKHPVYDDWSIEIYDDWRE
jgi:hypothetical protein